LQGDLLSLISRIAGSRSSVSFNISTRTSSPTRGAAVSVPYRGHHYRPANNRVENIEVYNIVCDSLGIAPKPNNGTLRLPLKPVGLHSDGPASNVETPADPPLSTSTSSSVHKLPTTSPVSRPVGVDVPEVIPTRPAIEDGEKPTPDDKEKDDKDDKDDQEDKDDKDDKDDKEDSDDEEETPDWWHNFVDKIKKFKEWATSLFEGKKEGDGATVEDSR